MENLFLLTFIETSIGILSFENIMMIILQFKMMIILQKRNIFFKLFYRENAKEF